MSHERVLAGIIGEKIVAILRGLPVEETLFVAQSLHAGGVRCFEVPLGHADALNGISTLREKLTDSWIGAGTVLTLDQVDAVEQAGAQYVISPVVDRAVIAKARDKGLVTMPGCFSPTECWQADQAGADIIKLFPAARLGAAYIRDLHGPLPHLKIAAVGGVEPSNLAEFRKAGAVAYGIGSAFTKKEVRHDAGRLKEIAQTYVRLAKGDA